MTYIFYDLILCASIILCHLCKTEAGTWVRVDEQDIQNEQNASPEYEIVATPRVLAKPIVDNSHQMIKKWLPIKEKQSDESTKQTKFTRMLGKAENIAAKQKRKREISREWLMADQSQKMTQYNARNKRWYEEKGPSMYRFNLPQLAEGDISTPNNFYNNNFQQQKSQILQQYLPRGEVFPPREEFIAQNQRIPPIQRRWDSQNGGPQAGENPYYNNGGPDQPFLRPLFNYRENLMGDQKSQEEPYENYEEAWHSFLKAYKTYRGEDDDERKVKVGWPRDGPCDPVFSFCDLNKKKYYKMDFKSRGDKQSALGKIIREDYSTFFKSNKWFWKNTAKNFLDALSKGVQVVLGQRSY